MNLTSEAIIFIFASEFDLLKSVKDFSYSFGRFSKHRLDWSSNSDVTYLFELSHIIPNYQKSFNDFAIVRELTDSLINAVFNRFTFLSELSLSH